MFIKLIHIILIFICLPVFSFAQTDSITNLVKKRGGAEAKQPLPLPVDSVIAAVDTVHSDSILLKNGKKHFVRRFFSKDYPNPRKAMFFALALPGAGQAYNKKWWKIPLVYGALGGLTWLEIENINTYKLYKTNYRNLVDGDPNTVVTDPKLLLQDATTMRYNRDIARQNLEKSSIWLGVGYLLSVTDAFVDAHMATFDVSDDLSLQFCPKAETISGIGPVFGVGIAVQF